MNPIKSYLIILLLLLFPLIAISQFDPIERENLLSYFASKPEYIEDYNNIVKLLDNANPEQLRKFSQCAKAVITIYSSTSVNTSMNFWDAYTQLKDIYKDETNVSKYLCELEPSFENISILINVLNKESNIINYNIFTGLKVSASESLEHFISDRKSGTLRYKEKTGVLIHKDGIDLNEYYMVLSAAYPNETSELEKAISNTSGISKLKDSYIRCIQWYETMYIQHIFNLTKDAADIKKKYAENEMIFCNRMMRSELDKMKQQETKELNVTGKWDTFEWGILTMSQTGTTVTGSYNYLEGTISGTLEGNKLTGTWTQTNGGGVFEFNFSSDGDSFTGGYNHKTDPQNWHTNWKGKRTK